MGSNGGGRPQHVGDDHRRSSPPGCAGAGAPRSRRGGRRPASAPPATRWRAPPRARRPRARAVKSTNVAGSGSAGAPAPASSGGIGSSSSVGSQVVGQQQREVVAQLVEHRARRQRRCPFVDPQRRPQGRRRSSRPAASRARAAAARPRRCCVTSRPRRGEAGGQRADRVGAGDQRGASPGGPRARRRSVAVRPARPPRRRRPAGHGPAPALHFALRECRAPRGLARRRPASPARRAAPSAVDRHRDAAVAESLEHQRAAVVAGGSSAGSGSSMRRAHATSPGREQRDAGVGVAAGNHVTPDARDERRQHRA